MDWIIFILPPSVGLAVPVGRPPRVAVGCGLSDGMLDRHRTGVWLFLLAILDGQRAPGQGVAAEAPAAGRAFVFDYPA